MTSPIPLRAKVALALAFLVAALYQAQTVAVWPGWTGGAVRASEGALYDEGFAGLRGVLPAQGTIGYLSDVPAERVLDQAATAEAYYRAQYAVAPLVIVLSTEQTWLLGNFQSREAHDKALANPAWTAVRNCNNGVVLFRRRDR